jgi:hypothetical protein
MKSQASTKIIIVLYAIIVLFWIVLEIITKYSLVNSDTLLNLQHFTQIPLAVLPLIGGVIGLRNGIKWGGWKSVMGRSTLTIALGLIAWSGGMIIWNYYLFFTTVSVPYPSTADAIFVLSWPLWTYGILQLSKAIGIKFAFRKMGKSFFVIPLVLILISIYLLVYVARGGITYDDPTKLFFDLFYPLGDIVILSVTASIYLLLRKFLGGIYKVPTLMLIAGFILNYFSDFMFSYTTTKGTYFNGHFVDFMFTATMFLLSIGLSMITPNILDSNISGQPNNI